MAELAQVNKLVAQSTREVQAAFDATDTARGAEALARVLPVLDQLAAWCRTNSDVLPFLIALIQAVPGNREAPP